MSCTRSPNWTSRHSSWTSRNRSA